MALEQPVALQEERLEPFQALGLVDEAQALERVVAPLGEAHREAAGAELGQEVA